MRYYIVSQRQTHKYEFAHRMLWSPKRKKSSNKKKKGILYKNMANVKSGDIIFHGYNNAIHAVSIALTNSYSFPEPKELAKKGGWNKSGYRVDLKMFNIPNISLKVSNNKPPLSNILSGKKYLGFDKRGFLKQVYLSELSSYSIKLLSAYVPLKVRNALKLFIKGINSSKLSSKPPHAHLMNSNDPDISRHHSYKNRGKSSDKKGLSAGKHISISINKMNDGTLGEYYTCQNLLNRFKSGYTIIGKSRIFYDDLSKKFSKIKPELDEHFGCDYVVISNKTGNKYFIDSKATTGGPSTSFYMSPKEKFKLNDVKKSDKNVYEIYRIFNLRKKSHDIAVFDSKEPNNGINGNENKVFIKHTTYEVKPTKKPK